MKKYFDNFNRLMSDSGSFFVCVFLSLVFIIVITISMAPLLAVGIAFAYLIGRILVGIFAGV